MVKSVRTAMSWAATADLVSKAWQTNAVPEDYTVQTLLAAQRQVRAQVDKIQAQPAQRQTADQLVRLLQQVQMAVGEMAEAIKRADVRAVAQHEAQLVAAAQEIRAVVRGNSERS
jgi:hypothetical protein